MASKYEHVFSPIKIRGIDFKNRVTLAPPSPNVATQNGEMTRDFVDWMRPFARGGATTLYVGNATVDKLECHDEETQIDLGTDKCILTLSWYAEMAAMYNCHASFEVNHNGKDNRLRDRGPCAVQCLAHHHLLGDFPRQEAGPGANPRHRDDPRENRRHSG